MIRIRLKNETYDTLKWLVVIVIPALTACYADLSAVWGWPLADQIVRTSAHICTMLGILIGISTAEYRNELRPEGKKDD